MGKRLERKGPLDEACREYETALRIRSKLSGAEFDLGSLLGRKGDLPGVRSISGTPAALPIPAFGSWPRNACVNLASGHKGVGRNQLFSILLWGL